MATSTRTPEYRSLFGDQRPGTTRAALTPPPPPPPRFTARQLAELRPLMVKFYHGQYNSLLGVTGISYEFIYKLVVVELTRTERTSLAMTCKTLLRDVIALGQAVPYGYRPLVSRARADLRPGGEYERWLLALERDMIPGQWVYCPYCIKIHKPQRAGSWGSLENYRFENRRNPDRLSLYHCHRVLLVPSHLHSFDQRFNALSLYWVYRYKEHRYRQGLGNFEQDPVVSSLGLDTTVWDRPAGTDRHLYMLRHSATVTLQGIFLRERKTLLLHQPTMFWQEKVNICWHSHYVVEPTVSPGTGRANYMVTVRKTNGRPYVGVYTTDKSLLIADNGVDIVHHSPPFNCLYGCNICNREWLIEPIVRPASQRESVLAGLRITVWLCVAWYDLPRRQPGEGLPSPSPLVPVKEVISNMKEPHRRMDATNTQAVASGACAMAFEGEDYFDRAQQDTRYIFP